MPHRKSRGSCNKQPSGFTAELPGVQPDLTNHRQAGGTGPRATYRGEPSSAHDAAVGTPSLPLDCPRQGRKTRP